MSHEAVYRRPGPPETIMRIYRTPAFDAKEDASHLGDRTVAGIKMFFGLECLLISGMLLTPELISSIGAYVHEGVHFCKAFALATALLGAFIFGIAFVVFNANDLIRRSRSTMRLTKIATDISEFNREAAALNDAIRRFETQSSEERVCIFSDAARLKMRRVELIHAMEVYRG